MSKFRSPRTWLLLLVAGLIAQTIVTAQTPKTKIVKRAKPPKFDNQAGQNFFPDIFAELKTPRPAASGGGTQVASRPVGGGSSAPATGPGPAAGGRGWSQLISKDTLEAEIKLVKKQVDAETQAPGPFAGKGYKVCRTQYSVAAVMFAVIAGYDGDVRWKADAAAARDLYARTAGNCKVGSEQAFKEAKQRAQELGDLIGGQGLGKREGGQLDWKAVADRGPLMQRLEVGVQGKLQPWTANKGDFSKNVESILHEAEVVAVLAQVLQQEGMEDASDESYKGFADQMKKAAREIVEACKSSDNERASKAVGNINKACSSCHEMYRA